MTKENRFDDVTDSELESRLDELMVKYQKIAPELSTILKDWGRVRREIAALNKERSRRENGKK